jgi:hypothetical protein
MARRDLAEIVCRIRGAFRAGEIRVTQHAQQEMVEENISLAEISEAVATAVVLEDYPKHRRGPCCLLSGETNRGRCPHVLRVSPASSK